MGYGVSGYVAHIPDPSGWVAYSESENAVWAKLYDRQMNIIQNRACSAYLEGLATLNLPADRVPQIPEVNSKLQAATGWSVAPVPALISFDRFFNLLANRQFPAATFIRVEKELDYLQEPDIFHEIFGHCPLLTHPDYANFMANYGALGVGAPKDVQTLLARLYWFTVEFGLIQSPEGLRCYGGGILSSIGETIYALESDQPIRKTLTVEEALRTPYRIDIYQNIYFIIQDFKALFALSQVDLVSKIREAQRLGDFPPNFPPVEKHSAEQTQLKEVTC